MTRAYLGLIAGGLCFLWALFCMGVAFPIEFLFYLALGWVWFLGRVPPQMQFDWNGTLTAAVCLILLGIVLHFFSRWIYQQVQNTKEAESNAPRAWQVRWTGGILSLILMMFVAGVSAIGVVHQTGWLITSPESVTKRYGYDARMQSHNNLLQIIIAGHTYHDVQKHFPPGTLFDESGRTLHGWQTLLLPYIEEKKLYDSIDLQKAWDHPDNVPHFDKELAVYLHPFVQEREDKNGFALSSYALNVYLHGGDKNLRLQDGIKDGASHTIYSGEAVLNPKPWGSPTNWRDPSLALNKHRNGFSGSKGAYGVNFAFVDGSVHYLGKDISPEVLKALATPNGGEDLTGAEY